MNPKFTATALVCVSAVVLAGCSSGHKGAGATTSGAAGSPAVSSSAAVPSTSASVPAPTTPAAATSTPAAPTPTASAHAVPAGFQPASVTFVSTTTGFVLGIAPCATGTCTTLVRTADGGHTWSLVATLPPAATAPSAAVSEVRFANAHDGWAFGPQLWSTHDGGASWHRITMSSAVSDVEAWGGVAYAVSGAHLLRTASNADAWAPVAGVAFGTPSSGLISLHGKAGWVVADNTANKRTLFATADGVTWKALADPCAGLGTEWALAGVAPVSDTQLYLLCGGGAGAGSQQKRVMVSNDAGAHAAATAGTPPMGGIIGGGVDPIAAASADVVALSASSGASEVYRSADAGHTWSTPLQQGDGGIGYYDLGFTTSTQGVVVYGRPGIAPSTQLLMTHDAGATWTPVSW
jgi:hypothetical protein